MARGFRISENLPLSWQHVVRDCVIAETLKGLLFRVVSSPQQHYDFPFNYTQIQAATVVGATCMAMENGWRCVQRVKGNGGRWENGGRRETAG